jgi:hypothetical protein
MLVSKGDSATHEDHADLQQLAYLCIRHYSLYKQRYDYYLRHYVLELGTKLILEIGS